MEASRKYYTDRALVLALLALGLTGTSFLIIGSQYAGLTQLAGYFSAVLGSYFSKKSFSEERTSRRTIAATINYGLTLLLTVGILFALFQLSKGM